MDATKVETVLSVLKFGGIIIGGISGVLGTLTRTHEEKPTGPRVKGTKQKTTRVLTPWGKMSVLITVIGLIIAGAAQIAESTRQRVQDEKSVKLAKEQVDTISRLDRSVNEQKETNARTEREFREKFQAVLVQLSAAKQEDSKKITEEKIRVIQKDFSEWANDFSKNLTKIKSDLGKTKTDQEQGKLQAQIDAVKKEIQVSQQTFPIISFAKRFVEETLRAYSKKSGKEIKVETKDLPENFYEKSTDYAIQISDKTIWKFQLQCNRPAGEGFNFPSLRLKFFDSKGLDSGYLSLRIDPSRDKIRATYRASIPFPDPATINGEHDSADYETTLRNLLQPIITAQLAQAIE